MVYVVTLNDDAALIDYAQPIVNELRANMVRVDSDFSATPFKAKIANAEQLRVHTMLVIGGRDMEAVAVERLPPPRRPANCKFSQKRTPAGCACGCSLCFECLMIALS